MGPEEVVMTAQQVKMILQPLLPPRITQGPAGKIGRTLSDREIEPFNIRSVQFSGILGVAPSLFPSPRRTSSNPSLHSNNAIVPSGFDDLAIKTSCSEDATGNGSIEFESVGGDHRDIVEIHAAREITKQAKGVSVAAFSDRGRRPEPGPHVDRNEDPARGLCFTTDYRTNLIGLQFPDGNLPDLLIVESTASIGCSFQPAIHGVPGYVFDSGNRGFVQAFDAKCGNFVESRATVLKFMVECPAIPTESFPTILASVSPTLSPPSLVEAIIDDGIGVQFSPQRTLLV
jgi:hypothetical protein